MLRARRQHGAIAGAGEGLKGADQPHPPRRTPGKHLALASANAGQTSKRSGESVAARQYGPAGQQVRARVKRACPSAGLFDKQEPGKNIPCKKIQFPIAVEPAACDVGKAERSRSLLTERITFRVHGAQALEIAVHRMTI